MKKSKGIYILIFVVVFAVLGGTYSIANYVEKKRDKQNIAQQNQKNNRQNSNGDEDLLDGMQKIKLNHTRYGYKKSIKTYLFIGTDHSGAEEEKGDAYEGSMADFLLLAVVDEENQTYGMVQIDRDTMVEVPLMNPDGTSYATSTMQICTSHCFGGNKKQGCKNTVSDLFGGIKIDGYYAISMDQIPEINHAVGGVEVTIKDDFSKIDPSMKKGETITLTDEQAYNYVQGRMNVGDGENTSRMARQREYMNKLMEIIKEKGSEDTRFIKQVLSRLKAYATTNVSIGKMYKQYKKAVGFASQGILIP